MEFPLYIALYHYSRAPALNVFYLNARSIAWVWGTSYQRVVFTRGISWHVNYCGQLEAKRRKPKQPLVAQLATVSMRLDATII